MIKTWQELEDFVKNFFKKDFTSKTPGSGNSKKEEDIIGRLTISQCKFTESNNISILEKDMDRLLEAGSLRDKIPFFFNKSNKYLTVTIPIKTEYEEELAELLLLYSMKTKIDSIYNNINNIKTMDDYNFTNSQIEYISKISNNICNRFNQDINKLRAKQKIKFDDITICDLFEG